MNKKNFPKNFLWGTATAAHQIEGGLYNDWSEWEEKNNEKRAQNAREEFEKQSKLLGDFPVDYWGQIESVATSPSNYVSGQACDHRNRHEEDFTLLKELNLNSYRFSIEWSRIEPKDGEFDKTAIQYYKEYIKKLKSLGIEPFVTLWHFTNPVWFDKKGAWKNSGNIKYFKRYVERIAIEFKDDVKFFCILNEPVNYTAAAYLGAIFPPAEKNVIHTFKVFGNFKKAHNEVYKILKGINPEFIVGTSLNFTTYLTKTKNPFYSFVRNIMDYIYNKNFLNSIIKNSDYIGVQHYTTVYVENIIHEAIKLGKRVDTSKYEKSDLGWYLNPQGLYDLLICLKNHHTPIYITEHGIADSEDEKREKFLLESLEKIHLAIQYGVDIKGYFHWTLFDNFEWDKGYWPRFGLYETDFKTQERKMRKSAQFFSKITKMNSL